MHGVSECPLAANAQCVAPNATINLDSINGSLISRNKMNVNICWPRFRLATPDSLGFRQLRVSTGTLILGIVLLAACDGGVPADAPKASEASGQVRPSLAPDSDDVARNTQQLLVQDGVAPSPSESDSEIVRAIKDAFEADQEPSEQEPTEAATQETERSDDQDAGLPLISPGGIALVAGNVYVSDIGNGLLRRVSVAESTLETIAQMEGTQRMVSAGDTLFIGTPTEILRIDVKTGKANSLAGSATAGKADGIGDGARFDKIGAITISGDILYVAEIGARIRKVEISTGKVSSLASIDRTRIAKGPPANYLISPGGMVELGGFLYLTDIQYRKVLRIDPKTSIAEIVTGHHLEELRFADGIGEEVALDFPSGIATDGHNLFVSDTNNNRIRKIDLATRRVTTVVGGNGPGDQGAGSADGPLAVAAFRGPRSIAFHDCCLYVSDQGNHKIRKIDLKAGVVSTVIGGEAEYVRADSDVSELLRKAEHGDVASQFALGNTYSEEGEEMLHCGDLPCADGDEKKRNLLEYVSKRKLEVALYWYLEAAKQGHAKAQYRVGSLAGSGVRVDGKSENAFEWYLAAANQGLAEAQDAVGIYLSSNYAFNSGAKANHSEAFKWFLKAAQQGLERSQVAVAYAYESGLGIEKNRNEALKWFALAADSGDELARHGLGCLLAEGSGAELIDAVKWIETVKLTTRDQDPDYSCVKKAESNMSEDQIARAKKLARDFVKAKGLAAAD